MSRVAYILLLAALAIPPCNAEPLGRLFLTAEQRKPGAKKPEVAAKATPAINGIIRSSRGGGTIWIDGQAQPLNTGDTQPPPERKSSAPPPPAISQAVTPP